MLGRSPVLSRPRTRLSFLAMLEKLDLPAGLDGRVVRHAAGDLRVRPHRHAELEVNLVVGGSATYLLGDRRYELTPGTLTWLFPGQDHVLVNQSADHELWWAVFTPDLVARVAREPHLAPLLADDPPGQHSRHLGTASARRLQALFEQVHDAETRDTTLANTGLAYLLALAWRTFLDTTDLVDAIDVHPAVRTVARLLQTNPGTADLTTLARRVGLSPSHLSRLFTAHTGIPLTTYRNHQRLRHFLRHYGDGTHTTMLTAALAAGFGSYAQFYRVFHRETGHSPAALRPQQGASR
jgi:AraC-like DNA-binding protein/quercetin dioxygenase-like cupin family protein